MERAQTGETGGEVDFIKRIWHRQRRNPYRIIAQVR